MYLAFCVCSIGTLFYALMVIMRFSDKEHPIIFTVIEALTTWCTAVWRFSFLAIIIERTMATMMFKTYEWEARYWFVAIFIFVFTVNICIFLLINSIFLAHFLGDLELVVLFM